MINHNHVIETDLSGLKVIDFVSSSGKYFSALSTLCCHAVASLSQDLIYQSFISETKSKRNWQFFILEKIILKNKLKGIFKF